MHEDAWNKEFESCGQLMRWYKGWSKSVLYPAQREEKKRREEEERTRREKAYIEARLKDPNSWESYFAKVEALK